MQKSIFVLVALVLTTSAQASWKEDQVIRHIDTHDTSEVMSGLTRYPDITSIFSAEQLVTADKIVVDHYSDTLTRMKWENDDHCQVADPSKVAPVEALSVGFSFYFVSRPEKHHGMQSSQAFAEPCHQGGTKVTTRQISHF